MSIFLFLADAADGGERVFPAFDATYFPSQLFWLALTFGTLYLILSRMILPRISANIERRSDTIADDLDEAARLNEQAEEAKQALEVSLAKARAKARETAAAAEATLAEEIATETRKVDDAIEKKLSAAEGRINELRNEAMANVESVATDATASILAKLGMQQSDDDIATAVKSAISGKA